METAQSDAEQRIDALVIGMTVATLDHDRAGALGWLGRLRAQSPRFGETRGIAADAVQRGVAQVSIHLHGATNGLAFSPDARTLWVAGRDGTLRRVDLTTGAISKVAHRPGAVGPLDDVVDGEPAVVGARTVACGGSARRAATSRARGRARAAGRDAGAVARRCELAAALCDDGTARLVDIDGPPHVAPVRSVTALGVRHDGGELLLRAGMLNVWPSATTTTSRLRSQSSTAAIGVNGPLAFGRRRDGGGRDVVERAGLATGARAHRSVVVGAHRRARPHVRRARAGDPRRRQHDDVVGPDDRPRDRAVARRRSLSAYSVFARRSPPGRPARRSFACGRWPLPQRHASSEGTRWTSARSSFPPPESPRLD